MAPPDDLAAVAPAEPTAAPRARRSRAWWIVGLVVFGLLIQLPNPFEELFWGSFAPRRIDRPSIPDGERRAASAERLVLLISFDGLAKTVLERHMPSTIADLVRDGSVAAFANDLSDSTLESHGVTISSQPAEESGFSAHTYRPWSRFRGPTIFTVCAREGLRCALLVGKAKLAALVAREPGCERFEYLRDPGRGGSGRQVLDATLAYIRERDPDFVMVHLPDVDVVGHRSGWGSDPQLEALTALDVALRDFLVAASMATSRHLAILISADHGGYGRSHREGRPEVSQVPWILWGDGIPHGLIAAEVSQLDTAPTVAALLGVATPREWRGQNRVPVAPATAPSR